MAETNLSLPPTHSQKPTLYRHFTALDPKSLLSQFASGERRVDTGTEKQSNESEPPKSSTMADNALSFTTLDPRRLILSQLRNDRQPNLLHPTTESFEMERGPRYRAYAELRESKLRMKISGRKLEESEPNLSPPKKQVKFQGNFPASSPVRRKGSSVHSVVAQSVPDFSSMLRKENRKPVNDLQPLEEKPLTPPPTNPRNSKLYGVGAKSGGCKSANAGEKRVSGGSMMARKSYANMEELKGLLSAAANAINGENRGGRGGRAKTILGYRQ